MEEMIKHHIENFGGKMKQIIEYSELLSDNNFLSWFLMTNFPEGIDNSSESSLLELIQENCILDKAWIDNLTGYYEGIFDENDGYIHTPKAIIIKLSTGDNFFVEFHPGDTIYYINDNMIGCTGAAYAIRKISLTQFFEYTSTLNDTEKIFLLPMIKISFTEKNEFINVIKSILCKVNFQVCSLDDVCTCILENCLE